MVNPPVSVRHLPNLCVRERRRWLRLQSSRGLEMNVIKYMNPQEKQYIIRLIKESISYREDELARAEIEWRRKLLSDESYHSYQSSLAFSKRVLREFEQELSNN